MVLSIEAATEAEIAELLRDLPMWTRDGSALVRVEPFARYLDALEFVYRVGQLAEARNHHPDLLLHYRKTTVRYWTHKIGGISRGDITMAREVEALRASMTAPSLSSNAG